MQITQAKELQSKFNAGLQITGEDEEGNLLWLGAWKKLNLKDIYQNSQNHDEFMEEAINHGHDTEEADEFYHERNFKFLNQ